MTMLRHVARVVGVTSSTAPACQVELRAGEHRLVADEPAAGTPITTTLQVKEVG